MSTYVPMSAVDAADAAEDASDFDGRTRIREMLDAAAPHIARRALQNAADQIRADADQIERYAAPGRAVDLLAFLLDALAIDHRPAVSSTPERKPR